ncbi:MAG: methyl-accepting chemotaxis protein, partial [Eubacterium sp.]|nr:methyl-accepting chemotaxis protein [Eubacterium sp.]
PYTDDWGEHISSYSPVMAEDGSVVGLAVIDTSMDWVNEQTKSLMLTIILVCAIVLVVGLLVVIGIVLVMRKKFVVLNNKISDLHDGSGDLTKEVELKSGDEFEVIGDNVNAFIRQIRDLVKNVGASSTEIQSAGVDLNEALATNAGAIDEMTDSITRISANMEECSATSSTAVDHLNLAADQIANFADSMQEMEETVAKEHMEAEDAAEIARKHKEEALAKINSIEEKMVKAIEEARKIDQIKEISDQITDISEQTKMLALNAQIEAARAGEQGKGFAVVATEVESLSNTIGQAVKEMNDITTGAIGSVEDLLEQSNQMSKFMIENVAEDYNSFVELGEKYGSSTLSLQESTHSLKESSSGLAASVRDIDMSIQEISKAIADSTNEVESISQSSSDIANSMHELGGISDRNRQQSESLSAEIDMFKC